EADPDLTAYASHAGSIQPIDGLNQRGVWLLGPGVAEDWQKAVFIFDYLWNFQSGLMKEPVPVLRAIRLGGVAHHIPLSIDRVPDQGVVHRLGKYRLLAVIGHGGMGRVWRANDIYGNIVAIKTLNAPQGGSPESVKRFRREAEVMARLQHRNICRIYEMNEHEGSHYIVMEFVDGLSLADILYSGVKSTEGKDDISSLIKAARAAKESSSDKPAAEPPKETMVAQPAATRHETLRLPAEQALAIFLKVCSAVEFAHTHGVLHRDLKPGNILLRSDGEPLVADFGLAKLSSDKTGASLSLSGNVLGTVENMAPEQAASSKSVDARADVYSLGTILFQMVTGRRHFEASGTLLVDIQSLQTHEPPRPRSLNPQVDPDLELIILKCLRQNPTERYRGVAALLADIERYLKGETISARPVTALEVLRKLIQRNRAASIVAGAALALILLIVTGAVWSLKRQLDISEHNKNLAQDRLREIEQKDLLFDQKEEDQKIAEMSKQELQKLVYEMEAKLKATGAELEENRNELELAQANILVETAKAEDRAKKAEGRAKDLEKQLEEARNAAPTPPPLTSGLPPSPASSQPVNMFEIQKELEGIESGFKQDFSQSSLAALERVPKKALDLLDKRIDDTASVLLKAPQSVHGWMLMGYLRLAALEFKSAEESFERALANHGALTTGNPSIERPLPSFLRNVAQNRMAVSSLAEPAARLRDFARQCSQTRPVFGKDGPVLADPLRQVGDQRGLSLTTADAISFFTSRPQMTMSIAPTTSPMRREASDKEIALELLVDNDLSTAPIVKMTQLKELDVTIEGNAKNLSSIASQTKVLTIRNAQQVDYQSLLNFTKLTRLDLSGSTLSDQPPLPKPALRLTHLVLANTKIQSLKFAVATPMLLSLDVGGCRLENIQGLPLLRNLRELTISPDILQNPKDLSLLKSTAIPFIRTPNDPPNQPRAEFFRKHLPSNQN
ncbi:MAG: protein kinase domain-containing protein, partial [Spartobacteria bacterium]